MPGLAASLLRAAGVFQSISMGFGSNPWHAACLLWRHSEDERILSIIALFPSVAPHAPQPHAGGLLLSERSVACVLWTTCFSLGATFSALCKWRSPSEEML